MANPYDPVAWVTAASAAGDLLTKGYQGAKTLYSGVSSIIPSTSDKTIPITNKGTQLPGETLLNTLKNKSNNYTNVNRFYKNQ